MGIECVHHRVHDLFRECRGVSKLCLGVVVGLPHVPDAWIDEDKTVGYEIPFTQQFYVFNPPRLLAEIDADLLLVTSRIKAMIGGLAA
jgi:hypothetical protein